MSTPEGPRGRRGPGAIARVSYGIYYALPVGTAGKMRVKTFVFGRFGFAFRNTGPYARWRQTIAEAQQWQVAASAPAAPAAVPTLPMAEIVPADGRWEWEAYAETRARIADVLARRRASVRYRRRPIIDIGDEDPRVAARRIALPAVEGRPDVSVIVPVFGQLRYTVECLLSLAAARDSLSFEVIVADDASSDGTPDVLSAIANLRLLRQPQNVGFLRNCNAALALVRGQRTVLLNNDTQVSSGWLSSLVKAFDEVPGIGAVGPRVVYPNGALQEAGVRLRREGSVEMVGLVDAPDDPRWSYPRDVDFASGACLMVDTEQFRAMGGFDERLAPAYCEDVDLGLRLRDQGMRVRYTPDTEVVHHLSKSSDALSASYKQQLVTRNMQQLAERHQALMDELDDVRVVAFYLPQFHPIPENDVWWGQGFTEWTNVASARPDYAGHDQPRIPTDLGYYDLRVPQVMEQQWALASRYGVDAFCYYYYWFDGHRLLEGPLERLLDPTRPAHPFCLCWANENWTRAWDGQEDHILMAQNHSPEDDVAVIRDIARYVAHPAYLRVGGKPLVLVYRVDRFPDFARTAERWREECRRLGIGEIYVAMVESFAFAGSDVDPARFGCDASVEYPAHYVENIGAPTGAPTNPAFYGTAADYRDVVVGAATRRHPGFKRMRTTMPGWDNTPRRQNGSFSMENATPGAFQAWMETAIAETKRDLQGDERLVFVNAWNEWAEGAYLEPDRRFGHGYLEAVRNARDAERLVRRQPGVL